MAADAIADAPRVPVAGLFGAFYSEQFTFAMPLQLLFADVTPTSDGGWAVTGFGPQNGTSAALRVAKLGPTGDVTWMMAAHSAFLSMSAACSVRCGTWASKSI